MEPITEPTNLKDRALKSIRSAILDGTLEIDQVYSTNEIAERLQVSRTPIREALLELENAKMIEIKKNKGFRVIRTSLEDLLAGFEVRLLIEVPLARLVAEQHTDEQFKDIHRAFSQLHDAAAVEDTDGTLRADKELHIAISGPFQNPKISEILRQQREFVLLQGVGTVPASRTHKETAEDHNDIVEAIDARCAKAAGIAMERHIKNTARLLITQEAQILGKLEFLQHMESRLARIQLNH